MSDQTGVPPLGALPAEQYLIRNWDYASKLPAADQRERLIREFLALGEIPKAWDGVRENNEAALTQPSPRDLHEILQPWRPASLRTLAVAIWKGEQTSLFDAIWLRTHLDASQDDILAELIEETQTFPPPHRVVQLDMPDADPAEAWSRTLPMLPEAASHAEDYDREGGYEHERTLELWHGCRGEAQKELAGLPVEARDSWVVYSWFARALQHSAMVRSVVVADAQAFATREVCLLLLDVWGQVVRWVRLPAEQIMDMAGDEARGMLPESREMGDGEKMGLAEAYRLDGQRGKRLYRLDDLLGAKDDLELGGRAAHYEQSLI